MKKHGDSTRTKRERLHNIWVNMRQRCNNPKKPCYAYYGAIGVSVCDAWNEYQGFKDWALSSGYASHLTLDRFPNISGNYEPDNCRWATKKAQSRNQKAYTNCSSKYRGVCWSKRDRRWKAQISIKGKSKHIGNFTSEIKAAEARDNYIKDNNLTHFILNF